MSEGFGNATIDGHLERLVEKGADLERTRFVQKLINLGVVRGSMLGAEWVVVYTIDGAKDMRLADLLAGDFGGETTL